MDSVKLMHPTGVDSLFDNLNSWRQLHPTWYYSAIGHFLLMGFCLLAAVLDERMLNGVSVWTKPFKFSLSLAVYFATLVAFVRYLPAGYLSSTRGKVLTVTPVVCAVLEMCYITWQAGNGQASHFNTGTPLHAAMYSLMGFGATLLVGILVWMGWVIARANSLAKPMVLAVVMGLILTFVLGGGFGMYLGNQTSHWVGGAATDANALWLVKWARDGGDLRVAHFFGMHAMQAIPLFAMLLPRKLAGRSGLTLVIAFSAAYSAFSLVTFIQAVQGQPFMG